MRGDISRLDNLASQFENYQQRLRDSEPKPQQRTIAPPPPEKARAICHSCNPEQYFWTMEALHVHFTKEHFAKRS